MRFYEFKLPKNKWVLDISDDAKHEVGDELINLVQNAYSNTPYGSFVNSIKDVVPSNWDVIDFDADPDVDSCVFYRKPRAKEKWRGHKIQGLGHDGTRLSKDKSIAKIHELLELPGWWIESSDALRGTLKKLNSTAITDVDILRKLFNDPQLTMIDKDTYRRTLSDGKEVIETVFGNPITK